MKKRILLLALCMMLAIGLPVAAGYFDFGGATISILGQSGHPGSRFIEGLGTPPPVTAYGLHEEAEALFNCTIEFGVYGFLEYTPALMTRLLGGESEYDVWMMNSHQYWQLMGMGAFFPMDTVLPQIYFDDLPGLSKGAADLMSFRGSVYGFQSAGSELGGLMVVAYSKELFQELGLADPQELYFDGDWTWDAMYDIARQATEDTTGDGRTDRWGIVGLPRMENLYHFAYNNDRAALIKEIDGRLVFTGNRPNWIEAINTVQEWVQEGIAEPGTHYDKNPWIVNGQAAMAVTPLGRLSQMSDDDVYALVPIPRAPGTSEHYFSSAWVGAITLPANSRHPEGMQQLVEFLYPPQDYELANDDVIRRYARDRVSAQILYEMHDNWSGYAPRLTQSGQAAWPAIQATQDAIRGQRVIASAMAELAAAIQAELDEAFND